MRLVFCFGLMTMLPRVLVVAPRLDLGGAEIHLSRVLPRLRQAGLDISLFTIERGGRLEQAFVAAGVPVLGIKTAGPRIVRGLRAARALRGEINSRPPDILHFFLAEPYLIGSLGSAGRHISKLMSRRSLSIYQQKYPFLADVERLLHRSMTGLIGNSKAVAAELEAECGEPDKVGIIHNGIETPPGISLEQRMACRRRLGLADDGFVMAVVANLIAYKGHSDLLEALSGVREKLGPKWRVLFAGRDQGIGDKLRRQAETAGIANHVVWLGEVDDPNAVLPAADVGVLPSHEEGFSNSLLEKMAHGLPVIATEVGGNIDAVVKNESGLLVPVRAPAELGNAIAALHGDTELRRRLGDAARQRVERFFSIEACTRRYLDLYSGLMRGNRPVAELTERSSASPSAIAAP